MSGKKGRSGRKPMGLALHLAHGTYRADRHGPKPATVGALAPAVLPIPKGLLLGLGECGRGFVAAVWVDYEDFPAGDLPVLHEAGAAVDLLRDLEVAIATAGGAVVVDDDGRQVLNPMLRAQRQTRATLVQLLNKLGLEG
jgi:hypothetical protein